MAAASTSTAETRSGDGTANNAKARLRGLFAMEVLHTIAQL